MLFLFSNLRGAGQVLFANNPIAGLLILIALWIQSGWLLVMALLGLVASTLTSQLMGLDETARRNGLYGYNGLLIGAALATFGVVSGAPLQQLGWCLITLASAALSTGLIAAIAPGWNRRLAAPLLTLPFIVVTYVAIAMLQNTPQELLAFSLTSSVDPQEVVGWSELAIANLSGFGEIFLADEPLPGLLILIALLLDSPTGAAIGLLGAATGTYIAIALGAAPHAIGSGLWGYNAILTAVALGGTFFAPNKRSLFLALGSAVLTVLLAAWLGPLVAPMPILTLPFVVVTLAVYLVQRHTLPSLVPVSMQALASPEEHRLRYRAAQRVLTQFRRQVAVAVAGGSRFQLLERSTTKERDDLKQIFNGLDQNSNGRLSYGEVLEVLQNTSPKPSTDEIQTLFRSLDLDANGAVEFDEFAELVLRHRCFVADADDFLTYLQPTDTDGDGMLSLKELNRTLVSVGLDALNSTELQVIERRMGTQPMTWGGFVRLLLVT
ncbi:MAG: urea transporter [Myxococcota bacterium]